MEDSNSMSLQGMLNIVAWTAALMFVTSPAEVISQSVEITSSTISSGDVVCPGEEGIFTCEGRGVTAIVWISDGYIDDQLRNTILDSINSTVRDPVNQNTVATLISMESNPQVIESQLRIVVLSLPLTPSITCEQGTNTAINDVVRFQVLGDPAVPQVTTEFETGTCTLNISVVPLSIAVGDIDRFVISINGRNQTITGSDTFLSYPVLSCADSHNIRASIVTRCGLMGQFSPIVTVSPDPSCDESACNTITDTMTDSTTDMNSPMSSPNRIDAIIVIAIVVPVAALIVVTLVFVGVITGLWCYSKTRPPKSVGDMKLESKNLHQDTKGSSPEEKY